MRTTRTPQPGTPETGPRWRGCRTVIGLAVLFGGVGLFLGGLWLVQRSLIFFPDSSPPPAAAEALPGGQEVRISTSDELELAAWYVPAPDPEYQTVLAAPGNAGNRAARAELGTSIVEAGYGVLLIDYRGYGGNPGSPTEEGLAKDVRAGLNFLTAEAGLSPDELIYFGESIGAAVVTELAGEHPPAGLVLRSPFTSLAEAGRAAYGVHLGWLLRDEFAVQAGMDRVGTPVAVIYGEADSIVPAQQSQAVAQASRDAGNDTVELSVPGADHNDPELAQGPEVIEALNLLTGR